MSIIDISLKAVSIFERVKGLPKRGRLVLLSSFVLVLIGSFFLLNYFGVIKMTGIPLLEKKTTVKLKTEYQNPFVKETQYVNPFDTYKNPFVVNK